MFVCVLQAPPCHPHPPSSASGPPSQNTFLSMTNPWTQNANMSASMASGTTSPTSSKGIRVDLWLKCLSAKMPPMYSMPTAIAMCWNIASLWAPTPCQPDILLTRTLTNSSWCLKKRATLRPTYGSMCARSPYVSRCWHWPLPLWSSQIGHGCTISGPCPSHSSGNR